MTLNKNYLKIKDDVQVQQNTKILMYDFDVLISKFQLRLTLPNYEFTSNFASDHLFWTSLIPPKGFKAWMNHYHQRFFVSNML